MLRLKVKIKWTTRMKCRRRQADNRNAGDLDSVHRFADRRRGGARSRLAPHRRLIEITAENGKSWLAYRLTDTQLIAWLMVCVCSLTPRPLRSRSSSAGGDPMQHVSQVTAVAAAARALPEEKRGIFLQRVIARLTLNTTAVSFTDAEIDDAVRSALFGPAACAPNGVDSGHPNPAGLEARPARFARPCPTPAPWPEPHSPLLLHVARRVRTPTPRAWTDPRHATRSDSTLGHLKAVIHRVAQDVARLRRNWLKL
jgi:hypothetical protein